MFKALLAVFLFGTIAIVQSSPIQNSVECQSCTMAVSMIQSYVMTNATEVRNFFCKNILMNSSNYFVFIFSLRMRFLTCWTPKSANLLALSARFAQSTSTPMSSRTSRLLSQWTQLPFAVWLVCAHPPSPSQR